MKLPFGLKTPSKGYVIFSGIAGSISGIVYVSNKNAEEARKRNAAKVSFLADKPCGVLEMPRKVLVFISPPPGDSIEKSRNWFREYVKPVLVAGAVDYEIKEAREPGQIENSVIEEIVKRRREEAAMSADTTLGNESNTDKALASTANTPALQGNLLTQSPSPVEKKVEYDGILAIGRSAYREVLSGYAKGCDASLAVTEMEDTTSSAITETSRSDGTALDELNTTNNDNSDSMLEKPQTDKHDDLMNDATTTAVVQDSSFPQESDEQLPDGIDHFSLPSTFSPVMYIPHVNIIGWTNIPYRLYMWYADYKRIEHVGKYVVAAVLNQTRPIEASKDADLGQEEKKYWIGDDDVKELKENDKPIIIDERIRDKLTTYTSDDLP